MIETLVPTDLPVIIIILIILTITAMIIGKPFINRKRSQLIPLSVNFHFTRKCNYECGFCFHTAKTSYLTSLEEAKRGLKMMAIAGMKKINFSGGEPFLYAKYLGELVKYCKKDLNLESVSIISNGSKVRKNWFQKYATFLDIFAISVDSFNENTNITIGRGRGNHLEPLRNIANWCREYNVKFKLNSVINVHNWEEDMTDYIAGLEPFRWKVFQCLLVDTENANKDAIRNARNFLISDEQFEYFCSRHRHLNCFVPESNILMKSSYIILDEYMRFLNKGNKYSESESILVVGVEKALEQIDFEADKFNERGGIYDWTKTDHLFGDGTTDCNAITTLNDW